jgi:hypothetical protein
MFNMLGSFVNARKIAGVNPKKRSASWPHTPYHGPLFDKTLQREAGFFGVQLAESDCAVVRVALNILILANSSLYLGRYSDVESSTLSAFGVLIIFI